ncbi:MAG: hypothetical protein LLG02_14335 [Pelosinus sp.]|nr:hypothetical protein [Pelosinus sp.]
MSWIDYKRIMKGIAILFICIMLGVMAAEKQLNDLTQYHDFVQACNIQGNTNNSYSLYLLGYRYTFSPNIEIYQFISKIVPAKGYEFAGEVSNWVTSARQICIKKAFQAKAWLEGKRQEIFYEMGNY